MTIIIGYSAALEEFGEHRDTARVKCSHDRLYRLDAESVYCFCWDCGHFFRKAP